MIASKSLLSGRLSESLGKQLEEESMRVVQLKRDIENYHRKSITEMERAQRLAQNQRDVLEKELTMKMELAEKEVGMTACYIIVLRFYTFVRLSVCPFAGLFVHLFVRPFNCLSVRCLSVCVCLFVCLFVFRRAGRPQRWPRCSA